MIYKIQLPTRIKNQLQLDGIIGRILDDTMSFFEAERCVEMLAIEQTMQDTRVEAYDEWLFNGNPTVEQMLDF